MCLGEELEGYYEGDFFLHGTAVVPRPNFAGQKTLSLCYGTFLAFISCFPLV